MKNPSASLKEEFVMERNRYFFPVFFILLGLALLVKVIFRFNYNMFSVGFAILLLMSGISLITHGFGTSRTTTQQGGDTFYFFNGIIPMQPHDTRARLFFASAILDLATPPAPNTQIFSCFGDVRLRVPIGYAVRANCNCIFGRIVTPRSCINGFGERSVQVGDGLQSTITVTCIFGKITLVQ